MSSKDFDVKRIQELIDHLDAVAAAKDAVKLVEHATTCIAQVLSFPGIPQEKRDELVDTVAKAIGAVGFAVISAIGAEMPEAEKAEGIELAKISMHEQIEQSIKEQESCGDPEILVVDLSAGFKQNVRGN